MNNLTPGNLAAQQYEEMQHKWFAMVLFKLLNPGESVHITVEDIKRYAEAEQKEQLVMVTHGHADSMEFRLLPLGSAIKLAEFTNSPQGRPS